MQLSLNEQALWAPIKDYFCPHGVPNSDAFRAYLGKYASFDVEKKTTDQVAQNVLGVILKHAPDEVFSQFLTPYYQQFRTSEHSVAFDAWLGENTNMRPDVVANALKMLAVNASFTHQVMVLKDIKKWYPERNIKEYVPLKLFKTKPSVVLKQLNPALADMPYLLEMCKELLQSDDPQAKTLGDTIARGCFIARYGMPEDTKDLRGVPGAPSPSFKYAAIAAFSMLIAHGVVLDPKPLLEQVRLRFNGKTVVTDALAYCTVVLEGTSAHQEMQGNAREVLQAVLDCLEETMSASKPNIEWDVTLSGLARSHASLEPGPLHNNVYDTMLAVLLAAGKQSMNAGPLLDTVNACDGALALSLTRSFLHARVDPTNQVVAIKNVVLQCDIDDFVGPQSILDLHIGYATECTQGLFFAMLPPDEVSSMVLQELHRIMREEQEPTGRSNAVTRFVFNLAQYPWMPEQREAFKQSAAAAPLILLYLYYGAAGHNKSHELVKKGLLPFTEWKPLPLLKKVYPEKMDLWNTMTTGLLNVPTTNPYFVDEVHYQKVMVSMYDAFSHAFFLDGASFHTTHGLLELGLDPLEYFSSANKEVNPAMEFELPNDMFTFD